MFDDAQLDALVVHAGESNRLVDHQPMITTCARCRARSKNVETAPGARHQATEIAGRTRGSMGSLTATVERQRQKCHYQDHQKRYRCPGHRTVTDVLSDHLVGTCATCAHGGCERRLPSMEVVGGDQGNLPDRSTCQQMTRLLIWQVQAIICQIYALASPWQHGESGKYRLSSMPCPSLPPSSIESRPSANSWTLPPICSLTCSARGGPCDNSLRLTGVLTPCGQSPDRTRVGG